jgi:hypothetical protein
MVAFKENSLNVLLVVTHIKNVEQNTSQVKCVVSYYSYVPIEMYYRLL